MGSGKEPIPVFATRIKAKYPQYKDIEDTLLVNKIIEKYPEYKEQVDIVVEPPKKKDVGGILSGVFKTGKEVDRALFQEGTPAPQEVLEQQDRDNELLQLQTSPSFKNDPLKELNRFFLGKGISNSQRMQAMGGMKGVDAPVSIRDNEDKLDLDKLSVFGVGEIQDQVRKEMFPTAQSAIDWKYREKKGTTDPKNETDLLAEGVIADYDSVKNSLAQTNGDFKKAAILYYGMKDPQTAAILKEGKELPIETQERLLNHFLNDPLVYEATESGQFMGMGLRQKYFSEKDHFRENNPHQWTNNLIAQIAQGREDYGENNPFLNLTGVKSSDRVMQKLYEDGKIDKKDLDFYDEYVRGFIASGKKKIPTTGLVENAWQSLSKVAKDVPIGAFELTGLNTLTSTAGERAFENLQEQENQVGVKAKSPLRLITQATGNLAGVVLPIGAQAKILQATKLIKNANVANQMAMGLTFYHDLYSEAEKKDPEARLLNQLQATLQSAVYAKLNPVLGRLSSTMVKSATPEIRTILKNLETETITGAQAAKQATNVFLDKAKKVAGHSLSASNQMALAGLINDGISGVFTGKYDFDESIQNAAETWKHLMLGTPLLNIAALGKNVRQTVGKTLYEMTENPVEGRATLEKLMKEDAELPKELLTNYDHAVKVREQLNEMELPQNKKEEYLVTEVKRKLLEDKIKNSPSKNLNTQTEKDLVALDIEQQMIANPEMGSKKFIEEMYDEELIPKSDRVLLENNETGKFEPSKVGAYLKFIAQQANGLGENWEVMKGGKPKMENYPPQIIEAANERWAKEIEKALSKEEASPTPQVAEVSETTGQYKFPLPSKDITDMSAAELDAYIKDIRAFTKRTKNVKDEDLSESDLADLYGKNLPVDGVYDPIEIQRIYNRVIEIEQAETAKEISEWVKRPLIDFARKQDKENLAVIKAAKRRAEELGIDPNELIKESFNRVSGELKDIDAVKQIFESIIPKDEIIKKENKTDKQGNIKTEDTEQPTGTATEDSGAAIPPTTEAKAPIYVERPATELSHKGLQNVANEFSLPDVKTRDRKSDIQLRQDARNTANEWAEKGQYEKNVERLIKEAEGGEVLTDKERVILETHLANLSAELRGIADKTSKEFDIKLAEISRLKQAGEKTRSEAGAALRIPGGGSRPHPIEDYADAMVTMKEAIGDKPLTEKDKAEVDKLVSEYEQRAKVAEQKVAEMETRFAELQAAKGVKKERKTTGEFKTERETIRKSIREKWEAASKDNTLTAVPFPYAKQLAAITPDVAKLVKSYIKEGVTEFKEVVKKVHDFIKEFNPDVTESDVVDIIAGKYAESKETKIDLEKKLKGIKDKKSEEAIKIRARIKSGDFAKKELPVSWVDNPEMKAKFPKEYKEALEALQERENAKEAFDIAVFKAERAKRSTTRKGIDLGRSVIATTKAIKSGIDDSAVMMQNIVAMISHPRSAVKALKEHALDAISEKRFRRYLTELHNSPNWNLIKNSGLDITDPKSLKEQNKEEIFDNNLLNKDFKILGKKFNIGKYTTRPFERAFTSLGNAMRVNMFTRIAEREYESGRTWETDPAYYKSLAQMLNTETGRGKLHTQIERASQLITAGIWSPRLMASRINMLGLSELAPLYGGKGYYSGLHPEVRKRAITDMVKFLGAGVSLMAFAGSQGAIIDDDPESPTFGTMQIGDKKYNAWGGMTPYAKTVYQTISGHRNIKGVRKQVTPGKLLGSFFRSRLTPAAGVTTNILTGKDFSGKPITVGGEISNLVLPLSLSAIKDAVEKDGMTGILTQGLPSFIGIGVSDQRDYDKKHETEHRPSRPKVERPKRD